MLSRMQYDSDDERDAVAAKYALKKKIVSQGTKKAMKNRALLPRTAGLRTLSELTTDMTKAGLDPSRIQERAEILAKVAGAKRKRQREEDAEMDVDEDAEMGDEGEWMDVDGEETPKLKRAKDNSGAVITKNARHPRTNRQLAGMRDEAVSIIDRSTLVSVLITARICSKHQKLSSCGTSGKENATCRLARERAIALSRPKW